ncbi:MAG: biopolymer transporter ExbD [Myxococcota bacterium]|jgi:biopolymer transport protein ExbD|nr:biopolymer transporter ExbD [Myxococcota bacterium]
MNFRVERKRRFESVLDITPLIDCMFLLLIFFLLSTTFARPTPSQESEEESEAVIDVQLARSKSGASSEAARSVDVFLDDAGLLYVDGQQPVKPNELKQKLSDLLAAEQPPLVNLRADRRASHGSVVEALDLIKDAGIETVNIVIEKSE